MIRNPLKALVNFVRRVRDMPPEAGRGYMPDNSQVREAQRSVLPPNARGPTGSGRSIDKIIGKALADSHKQAKH